MVSCQMAKGRTKRSFQKDPVESGFDNRAIWAKTEVPLDVQDASLEQDERMHDNGSENGGRSQESDGEAKPKHIRSIRHNPALVRSNQEATPQSHAARIRKHLVHFLMQRSRDRGGLPSSPEEHGHPNERKRVSNHRHLVASHHGRFFVSTRKPRNAPSRKDNEDSSDTLESAQRPRQYILETIKPNKRSDWKLLKKLGIPNHHLAVYESSSTGNPHSSWTCWGIQPNEQVGKYLHWTFRSPFHPVLFSISVIFFFLTMVFGFVIYVIAQQQPTCLAGVGTLVGGPKGGTFMDAYTLSWTTFCSVGYGVVHPAVSATEPDRWKCVGMTIVVSMESFSGVLFASMCGAILFAKVGRIQSFAQVTFSNPIIIRYGSGVSHDKDDSKHPRNTSSGDTEYFERIHPPILEFRINNRLHSVVGGEIIDASVNIVASIDASQVCPTVTQNMKRKGGKKKKIRRMNDSDKTSALFRANSEPISQNPHMEPLARFMRSVPLHHKTEEAHEIDEDPTGHLVPRRIFSKLEVETPDHPFFKRMWILRHELNVDSPLLKAHVRQLMQMNQGYWPKHLNTHRHVREAVHFDQILVSMSGTSNADVSTVSAQHAYDFSDLCVGYRFVDQIFHDPYDDKLRLDTRLINDLMEQFGGGGEELSTRALGTTEPHDMLVL